MINDTNFSYPAVGGGGEKIPFELIAKLTTVYDNSQLGLFWSLRMLKNPISTSDRDWVVTGPLLDLRPDLLVFSCFGFF